MTTLLTRGRLLAAGMVFFWAGLLAAGVGQAGTFDDDFDDGSLAPWITLHGSNSESGGTLNGSNFTALLTPSAIINSGMGSSNRFIVSAEMNISAFSGGLTLKRNGTDFCAIYVFGQGALWLASDSASGIGTEVLADGDIGFVPFNLPFDLSVLVDGTNLTVSVDGSVVWAGSHPDCGFTGSGEVGTFHRQDGASSLDSFSVVWSEADGDGDGYCPGTLCTNPADLPGDCNDGAAATNPSVVELCDGIDNNCDGSTDEGFIDSDGDSDADCIDPDDDGDGDPDASDCEPLNSAIFTAATESCDTIDSDCDGSLVDEFDDTDQDTDPDCTDLDDDGDGDADSSDCAPLDATAYAGATEFCDSVDSDCNGSLVDNFTNTDGDSEPDCIDNDDDNDQFPDGIDCDPLESTSYPNATESCDSVDSDCDGDLVDTFANFDADSLPDCVDPDDDDDGDADTTDCNDFDITVYVGAPEVVDDGIDQDCSGVDTITCFEDLDNDNRGTAATTTDPLGDCDSSDFVSLQSDDCDDSDPVNFPGNTEVCDDQDKD